MNAKILVFSDDKQISYLDEVLPEAGDGEVRVQTLFSAISHGTEMNVYRGLAPQWDRVFDPDLRLFVPAPKDPPDGKRYWTAADSHWRYPLAYGYANVGRVEACGSGVTDLSVGDLVYAYKPHQTGYVASAKELIRLPDLQSPALGVLFANLNTAYNGVLDTDIRIGDTVVVFGQGLIGLIVTQLVKRTGAACVVAVDTLPARREMALKLGADVVLDPAQQDVAMEVRRMTESRGADVVIEVSGSYRALNDAIRTAAPNTTVTTMSWYGGTGAELRLSDEFHHNRITLRCSQVAAIAPELTATHSLNRRTQQVLDLFDTLTLEPLLTDPFPFAEGAAAYNHVDQHSADTIQTYLTYA